ncbi:MAG: hypothetical protein KAI47_25985, partial [Deltaproteobacteria bacterium]|nr:hypothetical protein [Deltaproteobacteria bacterium]
MSRPSRRFLTLVAAALAVTFVFVAVPASPARAQNQVPPRNLLATLTRHRLPPPLLIFRRPQKRKPMELATVKIDARIVGHQAETTMTLSFYNPNNAVLEGDLVFPLPEGATISGYALDINGQLVDGVIVDKDEAREVFEEEVRKGVDPGLVEATRGNSFKTRIFPIPAKGSRTIRVSYVSEVLPSNRGALYYLPLAFKQKVKSLALRVEVVKASAKPQIVYGGSRGLSFGAWRDSFVASTKLQDTTLNNDLYVALPKIETRPLHVEKTPDGQLYFSLRDRVRSSQAPASRTPARIGLYWDASLSRAKVDHRQELALLDTYLQSLGATPVTVSLIILRNIAERARTFRLPAHRQTLLQALKTLRYDGGTQLGAAVPQRAMKKVDLNLLFSDGLSNFGEEDPRALKAPVYTINAATTAEHTFLRYLALRTGGAYLNLRRLNPKQAAAAIGKPVFSFLSAEIKKDASQLCLS